MKVLKKIYGQVEEDERWKIKKKEEIKDILQGADIVKCINSPSDFDGMAMLKGCKTMNPKTHCNRYNRRKRYRGGPRTRWRDEVEEDLKLMGIKYEVANARDCRQWRKSVLEYRVHIGL